MNEGLDLLRRAAARWPDAPGLAGAEGVWTFAEWDRRVDEVEGEDGPFAVFDEPVSMAGLARMWAAIRGSVPLLCLNQRLPEAARREQVDFVAEQVDSIPEAVATLLFTSGSTGTPKVVMHSMAAHEASARGANANMPLGPGDAWLLGLPVYHVAGIAILCRCLLAGACVRLPGPAGPEPTHFSMVPTQLQDAVEATWDWSAVKGVLLGGAAISERLVRWAVEAGVPLHCSWGMTETASQVTATPVGAAVEALLTAGRCLPEREVRVVEGEIQVRGATMFSGYLGREARKPGDWFATGDVGELDTGGWLRVLGRKDSQFISGGENIHPEVIERAMAGLDGVARVMVVPVLDERFGQRPAALVEVDREEWTPEEWATALETLLPKYMVPVDFIRAPGDWKERMKWSRVDVQEWVTTS